ncbi:13930_t:CDS:2 [Funneliformis geosporum]|nr:13930_t:CDS:2 [Funneliformis geosporum]
MGKFTTNSTQYLPLCNPAKYEHTNYRATGFITVKNKRQDRIVDKEVENKEDILVAININICMILNRLMGSEYKFININICMILNRLMGSEYKFSRRSTDIHSIPDFNCHLVGLLILVMKAKRKHV